MLRWLIAILILANLLAFAAIRGLFGPTPASGSLERQHLNRQIHPEGLTVRPIKPSESVDVPVVGGPVADPAIQASTLAQ
ncbi:MULTISPECIES: hypothetical protein [Paraburkholderia]|uniref:Uncharacterized protein n=1 Tax=Paraburkholderia tropica TaxID=92647 RepID=A0A1A5X802_9BURK|nr:MULTISPECIES: hypothetical protein [Paraburkholderia]MBB2978196.1 hypothetical protein [Paraburkholderia tropica]MBB2998098.1 hypothetical protein [Paraburkholderia tropica]MBB6317121.1 hypothetical protein [Paraburkholderia tropica]MDE1142311.1 hypothetical protein [Paraburkholderia tropica]OBR49459.1 hypothetical protein A6456_01410 [Paraburkholderia tropica]